MVELGLIPTSDWIAVAIGIIGLVTAYLQSRDRLPKWARTWLSKIGIDTIEEAIVAAEAVRDMTPEDRRKTAVEYLVKVVQKRTGLIVPTSVANLLVEYVYQMWKTRRK